MKIKLSKSQWEKIGQKAGWKNLNPDRKWFDDARTKLWDLILKDFPPTEIIKKYPELEKVRQLLMQASKMMIEIEIPKYLN